MRVTKAMLQARLSALEQFCRMELAQVAARDVHKLREERGFTAVECYAVGIPFKNEIGCVRNKRILIGDIEKWEPKT